MLSYHTAIGTQNVHGVQSPFFVRPLTQCLGSKIPVRRNSISTPTKNIRCQSTERCRDDKENSDNIGFENLNERTEVIETKKQTDGITYEELKISPIREEDAEKRELQSCSVESRASLRSRSSAYSSTNSVLQSYQPRSRSSLSTSASSRKSSDDNCNRYSASSPAETFLDFAAEDARKENAITDAKYNFKCLTYEVPMPMKEDQGMKIETMKSNTNVHSSPPLSVVFAQYDSPSLSRSQGPCTSISPMEASSDLSTFKCMKNGFTPGQDVSMIVQRSDELSLSESFSTSSPFSTFAASSQKPARYLAGQDGEISMRDGNDDLLQDFYPNEISFFCGVLSDSAKKSLEGNSPKSSQHLVDQFYSVDGRLFPENDESFNRSVVYNSKSVENEKSRTYSTWESETNRSLIEVDPELSMLWETETDDLLSECGSKGEEMYEEIEVDKMSSISVILKYLAAIILTGLVCGAIFIPVTIIPTSTQPPIYSDLNSFTEFSPLPDISLSIPIPMVFSSDVISISTDISTYVRNTESPIIFGEKSASDTNFDDAEIIWIELKEIENEEESNEKINEQIKRKGRLQKESKEIMVIMQDLTALGTNREQDEEEEEIISDIIYLTDDSENEESYATQITEVDMINHQSAPNYIQDESEETGAEEIGACAVRDVRKVWVEDGVTVMEYYRDVECSAVVEEEVSIGFDEIPVQMLITENEDEIVHLTDDSENEESYATQITEVDMINHQSAPNYIQDESEETGAEEIGACAVRDVRKVWVEDGVTVMEYYRDVECSAVVEEEVSIGFDEIPVQMLITENEDEIVPLHTDPEIYFLEENSADDIDDSEEDSEMSPVNPDDEDVVEVSIVVTKEEVVLYDNIPAREGAGYQVENEVNCGSVEGGTQIEVVEIATEVSKDEIDVRLTAEEIMGDLHAHEIKIESVARSDLVQARTYVPGETFQKRKQPRLTPHSLLLLFGILSTVSFFAILVALVSNSKNRITPLMEVSAVSGVLLNELVNASNNDMSDIPIELDCAENVRDDFREETVEEMTPAVEDTYVKKERKMSDKINSVSERRVTRNTAKNLPEHSLEELSFPATNSRKSLRLRK